MVRYYPQKLDLHAIIRKYPELDFNNQEDEARLAKIRVDRARGKGAPKKAKTKGMPSLYRAPEGPILTVSSVADSRRTQRKK